MTSSSEMPASTVEDWATDFDHTDPGWAADAPAIWDDLRGRCPMAHSDRFGGVWLPTRHSDVSAIAHDTEHFTSQSVIVANWRPEAPRPIGFAPPITSDPPFHEIARRILLPAFSPKAIRALEEPTRRFCAELVDGLVTSGRSEIDAAAEYSQHIPVRVIAHMLGVPDSDGDKFRGFIHRIVERAGQVNNVAVEDTMVYYLAGVIADHRVAPRDDLVGFLLEAEIDGHPLTDEHILGTVALLLIAGIDTTWSAIGASLWHLAQHPDQCRRLRERPELLPMAIEEFLRVFAPVTMARLVATDVEVGGRQLHEGDWVLLPFPAANRDPAFFDRADEVVIDRQKNRHAAFGLGIHRCIGSNLARMELTIAVQEWLARVPHFELADPAAVRWAAGQVRGPRELPVRLTTAGRSDV